jgi:hypothetical protein
VPSLAGYLPDYTRRGLALYAVVANAGPYDSPLAQSADGTPEARLLAKLDDTRADVDLAEAAAAWDVDANVTDVNGSPAALDTGGGAGGTGTGSGDFAVDHSGGAGVTVDGVAAATDCMRILDGANGVDNVEIAAFLAATYAAGSRGASDRAGTTYTGSDGRWEAPLMLDNGSYVLVFSKGGYLIGTSTVGVP